MPDPAPVLKRLRDILSVPGNRVGKARRIAAAVREAGEYGWVRIYEGDGPEATLLAWSGVRSLDGPSGNALPVRDQNRATVGWLDAERREAWLEPCASALAALWT